MKNNKFSKILLSIFCFLVLVGLLPKKVLADDTISSGDSNNGTLETTSEREERKPEYSKTDSSGEYYIASNENLKELFTFKLSNVANALEWLSKTGTFTVLKEYVGEDGNIYIKGYYNVPNLQALALNKVISNIGDGYTNQTYKVEDTQWLVPVGISDNIISKYGFKIPNYTYLGEYPKAYMSSDGLVPDGIIPVIMKGITALFGGSFIDVPSSEQFNTINYYNHGYGTNSENVINFFKDNWIPYFQDFISTSQFSSPEEFRKEYVSNETVTNAKSIIENLSLDVDANTHLEGEEAYKYAKSAIDKLEGATYNSATMALFGDGELVEPSQTYIQMFAKWRDKYSDKYPKQWSDEETLNRAIKDKDDTLPDYTGLKVTKKSDGLLAQIVQKYEDATKSKEQYDAFIAKFNKDDSYRQCLINSDEVGACKTTRLGKDSPTTISTAHAYVLSGVYEITKDKKTLTREDTIKILQKLQDYCGGYYNEVLSNLTLIMKLNAKSVGVDIKVSNSVDSRVMPYDIDSMSAIDRQSFTIRDPRVKLYKDSMFGSLITKFTPSFNFNNYIKLQGMLVDLGGRITELSVFFQTLMNFDFLDTIGLSPVDMFTNGFATLFYLVVLFLTITRIVKYTIEFFKTGRFTKIIAVFLVALLEVGFVANVMINPQKTWDTTKKTLDTVMNFGEKISMEQQHELSYMFGDNTSGVTYYLPYLDLWSTYNTGYGILDKEQYIKKFDTEEIGMYRPRIADRDVQHWSVVLADAFSYHGDSNSIYSVADGSGKLVNGGVINNNAYRVVDHFNAPRVNYERLSNGNIKVSVTQNENYNGKFQHGFFDIISKFIGILNVFFISLVKLLTFFWLWYRIYTFVFITLMEKTRDRSWLDIISDTLSPILAMILLGAYSALIVYINGYVSGLVAILIQLGIFMTTRAIILTWSTNKYFPKTLVPLKTLLNMKVVLRERRDRLEDEEMERTAERLGLDLTNEDMKDRAKLREILFYPDGTPKYPNDKRYTKLYKQWKEDVERSKELGFESSPEDKQASNAISSWNLSDTGKEDVSTDKNDDNKSPLSSAETKKINQSLETLKHNKITNIQNMQKDSGEPLEYKKIGGRRKKKGGKMVREEDTD